jgi:hypothetical protein
MLLEALRLHISKAIWQSWRPPDVISNKFCMASTGAQWRRSCFRSGSAIVHCWKQCTSQTYDMIPSGMTCIRSWRKPDGCMMTRKLKGMVCSRNCNVWRYAICKIKSSLILPKRSDGHCDVQVYWDILKIVHCKTCVGFSTQSKVIVVECVVWVYVVCRAMCMAGLRRVVSRNTGLRSVFSWR